MQKPVFGSIDEARHAIINMEKARLTLYNNGMLSEKYNKILKKRIWKLVKDNKINVADLSSAFINTR